MLLSGMRRTSACEARLEHLSDGCLHVPNPKGGTNRAFDLPLSGPLKDLLSHRATEAPRIDRKTKWLFPSDSKSGHVTEVAQHELNGLTGHALRHVFSTLAVESGVPLLELKYLLNHAASNVTMGYIHVGPEHLQPYQEKASRHILERLGLQWTPGVWPPVLKEAAAEQKAA